MTMQGSIIPREQISTSTISYEAAHAIASSIDTVGLGMIVGTILLCSALFIGVLLGLTLRYSYQKERQ
jgi:hypothetical protein